MADVFDFYVRDNRKINFEIAEPIMREDSGVTDFRFHIPKTLNGLEVSDWSWWFVFVNANKEKYSIALTLSDDPERPLDFNIATYTVDYAMSIKAGSVQFALEAINAGTGGAIDNEWHTLTYETKVKETLQGNQAEYAETESDIISALIQEVRTKMNQIIGGATPTPVASVSAMTDTSKLYLLTTDGDWYYYNGTTFVSGGVYGAGVTDAIPTQGSSNAVRSGGVYDAVAGVADDITSLKQDLNTYKGINADWTTSAYINKNNGNLTTGHQLYDASDYMVCGSMDVYVRTYVYDDIGGIAFYDAGKSFISGYNPYSDNGSLIKLTVPTNAKYFRICCKKENVDDVIVTYGDVPEYIQGVAETTDENADIIEDVTEKSINLMPVDSNSLTINGVNVDYADGVLTVDATASATGGRKNKITKTFLLKSGTYTIKCFDTFETDPSAIFLEKASDDTVIATIYHANSATFTLSENTYVYLGINVTSGNTYSGTYRIQIVNGTTVYPFVAPSYISAVDVVARETDKMWAYAMGKILCIGDSLTSGANYTGTWAGASIDQNYPRILGRMLNADVTNAGVSGINAIGWYTNYNSTYTFADYDTFIIWLGTNGGLTDTLDTDVTPYADYADYANTNTGCYCKIIEKIKTENPDALIVLVTLFQSSGDVAVSNVVIEEIAEKYSLYVIDNSELTYTLYPQLHGNISNPHFTKAGNIYLANRFVTKMNEYFTEDPIRADYGETARTN